MEPRSTTRHLALSNPRPEHESLPIDGHDGGVPVRDSKAPTGPALVIAGTAWSAFVTHVKGLSV
ncbi:DUF397 domain-containing protein [Streptomyces sp. NPDC091292]|uniref:DUF397 domain-containing protein n=1 Tax=Streptomyces sp. NPDC091292 TaxID=3365991 RepID=UPI003805C26E